MATGPQLHHVRHGDFRSAMLSLWSQCRFSAKGNEGTLLGCLLVVSTLTFVVFAAFTLYFTQCQLRELKKESGKAVRSKFPPGQSKSPRVVDPPVSRQVLEPPQDPKS